jgi:hypothetical protein
MGAVGAGMGVGLGLELMGNGAVPDFNDFNLDLALALVAGLVPFLEKARAEYDHEQIPLHQW